MNTRIVIKKYLPTTAKTTDHPRAIDLNKILDDLATEKGGKISEFKVSGDGIASVTVTGDEASDFIVKTFKDADVDASKVSSVVASLEVNKMMQRKADEKAAKKKKAS